MPNPIKTLVQEYGWVHLGIGLTGNLAFFVGSVFFLPSLERFKLLGIWLFIIGAGLMFIGALGRLLVDIFEEQKEESLDSRRGHISSP